MEIARRNHREPALPDLGEQIGPAGDLPGIQLLSKLFASVPEVIGLLLDLAGRDGVRGDGQRPLRANRATEVPNVGIGMNEAVNA